MDFFPLYLVISNGKDDTPAYADTRSFLSGISNTYFTESISDHMYRMSVITMLCPPEEKIDKDRCIKLAIIHDMAEALVGDITPRDNVPKGNI